MSKCSLVLLIVIALYGGSHPVTGLKKDWTYRFEQIHWNTTNPDIIRMDMRTVRIAPGIYGINGSFVVGLDVGDEMLFEAKVMRSVAGSSEYTPTPFSISQCTLTEFMNRYYKLFFKESIENCSNIPQFEDEFKPPFKKGEYVLNSCVIATDSFPTHMSPGLYKVTLVIRRPLLVVDIVFILKVISTLM